MKSIDTKQRTPEFRIGRDLLSDPDTFRSVLQGQVFVITEDNVARHHLDRFLRGIAPLDLKIHTMMIEGGEEHKTLETVVSLYSFLSKTKATRSDTIVAFGGGVVGDVAGFVASTFKRGMNFVQVPTTLLAQVDAAIGGKTGFNLPEGKNLVGTFYRPQGIICDTGTLETLAEEVYKSGLAEVVKYGLIIDPEIIDILRASKKEILERDHFILIGLIARCYKCKNQIISVDEREELGLRELLNYGHTIGHALEAASHFDLTHGEAVSLGMVLETKCAVDEGIVSTDILDMVVSILSSLGLPTVLPTALYTEDIRPFLLQDKKMRGGTLRAPLLVGLGKAKVREVRPTYFLKQFNGGDALACCNVQECD
ncbi:MAG: 3-dehydroquinate synthase [Candidatus Thorarchaeota archaeon]|nr:3-dehydroquinate synthase [Candidatus Thorarchaeota archaeon]